MISHKPLLTLRIVSWLHSIFSNQGFTYECRNSGNGKHDKALKATGPLKLDFRAHNSNLPIQARPYY